jgi:hypothetical protein
MTKCLLHKNHLDEFKTWCIKRGIEIRPGRGHHQVLQVLTAKYSWQVVYERCHAPEHYTVTWPLEAMMRRFINDHGTGRGRPTTTGDADT